MDMYTAGPWTLEKCKHGDALVTFGGTLENLDFKYSAWLPVDEPDARLITSAPDLLRELRAYVEFFSGNYINTGEEFQALRAAALAAIAKAEGATP